MPAGRAFIRHRFVADLRENSARAGWLDDSTRRAYAEPLIDNIDRVVAMAIRLSRADEPEEVNAVIARLRVPVTILVGELRTKAGPALEEFAALERLGPLLRFERIAGSGHFPHEESPDEVVRQLIRRRYAVATDREGER